ncbi:MAG: hypothetical protein BAJALOKI1v1_220001 [Promethearchaeota archaeon]|nr:MAG: hypothetical protein BAJALOKI1v1_220001 [Candidatus Lokiarchaeota archaeon]
MDEGPNRQKKAEKTSPKNSSTKSIQGTFEPRWSHYFVYEFENKDKIQPILDSAFHKFAETPINKDDAMGRIKYALISYLTSTKTENAKLYYAIIRFLIDIIDYFHQEDLIDWIHDKVIPNIESKFLYELALLDLVEICVKLDKIERAQLYIKEIISNIASYPSSEQYNIMNSLTQLVKRVKYVQIPSLLEIVKKGLLECEEKTNEITHKIQIIELLEDLHYIEEAFSRVVKLLKEIPQDSVKIEDLRKIKKRLSKKPL